MAKLVPGVLKGLGVTFRELAHTVTPKKLGGGAATVQYPHEKEAPATRSRGVIGLREVNCTVCMLCARSCPDWCIYIEGHKEKAPPRRPGGKPRTASSSSWSRLGVLTSPTTARAAGLTERADAGPSESGERSAARIAARSGALVRRLSCSSSARPG